MIDLKEIFSVHGVSEDGRVMLDPTDWNAIVLHIQELEKREIKIRKESFLSGFEASGEGFNGEHGATKEEVSYYLNEWLKECEK